MSFNDLGQYSANHKVWDHVGNILPDIELSEGERPAVQFKPAAWLPVAMKDKYYEEYYTVLPGKIVSLDPNGDVMPAGYGLTGATVTYAQADVDAGVIDVSTGLPVTTAGKAVVLAALDGTRGSGWTKASAGTVNNSTYKSGFLGQFGAPGNFGDATVKYPIGIAPYGFYQWAGGDGSNPANLRKHNHMLQHQVAVLCDYVIRLPLVPAAITNEAVAKAVTNSALVIGTNHWHTRAYAAANAAGRYNATTGTLPVLTSYPVVALALDKVPMAVQSTRTTIALASDNTSDDLTTVLVNERTAISAVRAAGDYFIDYPASVIFVYSADGATLPAVVSGAAGNLTITYYEYEDAASTFSKFASVCGAALKPGDFLKADANSNFTLAAPAATGLSTTGDGFDVIVGQVLAIVDDFNEGLAKVRTAYLPAIGTDASGSMANGAAGSSSVNLGQMDQMPGSATRGYTDLTTYAGAVKYAIINLVSR